MKIDFNLFKKVTGYNIKSFFNQVNDFIKNDYPLIVNYYNGGEISGDSLDKLNFLIKESNKIEPLFRLNNNQLSTIDFWELLDLFSNIQIKLETINNSNRWFRTTKLNTFTNSTNVNYIQRENETLENITSSVGKIDIQNSWVELAIENQIIEENYTNKGGLILSIPINISNNISIDNIVDILNEKNILGKDILKKITFLNNDISTINFEEALNQSFNIKINLLKNSIPEFPEYGMKGEIIGTNVAAISYPSIFRDFLNIFKKDKRWSSINLLDIYRKNDSIFLKIEAISILKNSLITNIKI